MEVAEVLHDRGLHVTFVIREGWYFPVALDRNEASLVAEHLRAHGVDVRLGAGVDAVDRGAEGRIRAVRLAGGAEVAADLVVSTIGGTRRATARGWRGLSPGSSSPSTSCSISGATRNGASTPIRSSPSRRRSTSTASGRSTASSTRWRWSRAARTSSADTGRTAPTSAPAPSVRGRGAGGVGLHAAPSRIQVFAGQEHYFTYFWPLKIEYLYPSFILEQPFLMVAW